MLSVSFSDACNENNDNVSGVNSTVTSSSQHSIADIFSGLSSKRVYYCQRCLNHGVLAPRKNHKCQCIHAQCNCAKCILVERRRVLNTQLHELEENEQQQQHFQVDVGEEETPASNSTSDSLASGGDCQSQSQQQTQEDTQRDQLLSSKGDESHTAAMMLMLTSSMVERKPTSLQDQQQALRRAIGLESLHALLLQAAGTGFDSAEEDSNNNKNGGRCSIRPSTTTIDEAEMDDDDENGHNNNFAPTTNSVNTLTAGSNNVTKMLINTSLERGVNNSGANVNRCSFSSSSTSSVGGRSGSTSSFCDGAAADDLKVFRSRISTSNSIRSNATTNSSFSSSGYSGSSTAPSPAMFFHDFYGGVLETARNFVANDDNICEDGTISAFRRVSGSSVTSIRIKGERVPNCQKCGQHGRKSRLKGHKRFCPFKNCECAKCQVITERQKLMADQIKIRRRQCKDTLLRMKREKLSTAFVASGGRGGDTFENSSASTDDIAYGTSNCASATTEVQCSPSPLLPLRIAPSSFTSTSPSLATYLNTLNLLCKQLALVPSSLQPQTNLKANFKEATLANTGNTFGALNLKSQESSVLSHVCSPSQTLPLLSEGCSDEKSTGENTGTRSVSPLSSVAYPTPNGTQRTSSGDAESTISHFGMGELTSGVSTIFPIISQSVIKTPAFETTPDTQQCRAATEKLLNHLNTATTSTPSNGANVTNSLLIKSLLLGQQNNNDNSLPANSDATFYQQQQFLRLLGAVSATPIPPHSNAISPLNVLNVQQNVVPMVLQASHSTSDVHHPSPSIFPSISSQSQYLSSLSTQSSAINAIIASSPNIQLFNRSVTSTSSTSTTTINVAENSPMLSKLLTSIATPPINVTDYQLTTSSTPVEQNVADTLQ